MKLNELAVGKSAAILRVGGKGALRQHFLDMGMIPGAEVTVIKLAPMGDPMELQIHGYELTLRLAEAEQIEIKPIQKIKSRYKDTDRIKASEHPGLARIGRHAPISRRQLDNAPHLRNRRPGLAQGRRALRLPFDDRRLPRKIQSRRLRIPCRRPDVFAHPQQGLGPLGRKRPAVRQFPHQQRHHGRQFGKPCAQRPGRRDRTGVRRQPRVDVGRHLFPPDQLQDGLRRHPLRAVDHGQIRWRRKADR